MTADESSSSSFWKNRWLWSALLLAAILFALIWPSLPHYTWSGHDEYFALVRTWQMAESWRAEGPFHAPWQPDVVAGYGLPAFTFYAPLAYYVSTAAHTALGLSLGASVKLSYYLALFLSAILLYALAVVVGRRDGLRHLPWWALAAAALYVCAPYHLTDMYPRAALAECWSWAGVAGLWLAVEISRRHAFAGVLAVALAYHAIMVCHNITALYATVFVGLYVVLTAGSWRWPLIVIAGGLLGGAMSAYYWLPAMRLKPLVGASILLHMGGGADVLEFHSVPFIQHFLETPGRGGSRGGVEDNFAINTGLAIMLGVLLAGAALFRSELDWKQRRRGLVPILLLVLVVLVMSPYWPWEWMPEMFRYVQHGWRLLIFTALFGILALLRMGNVVGRWIHPGVLALLAALLALPAVGLFYFVPPAASIGDDEDVIEWYFSVPEKGVGYPLPLYLGSYYREYQPLAVPYHYFDPEWRAGNPAPESRFEPLDGAEVTLYRWERLGNKYTYDYEAPEPFYARVHLFGFPGWKLWLDGAMNQNRFHHDPEGILRVLLPAGRHRLVIDYTISNIGEKALWLSYGAWLVWCAGLGVLLGRRQRTPGPSTPSV